MTAALNIFHDKILAVLEKIVPKRKKPSKTFKPNICRIRKTIWRIIGKLKKILVVPSIQKLALLIQNKNVLEEQLKADYSAENCQQEDQAIFNIRANPK